MAKKSARRKQQIPKDESKAARFVRVVTPRVDRAYKVIKQIGLCAGSTYASTAEQEKQIVEILQSGVNSVKAQFQQTPEKAEGFRFKE